MEYDRCTNCGDSVHPQIAGYLDDMEIEVAAKVMSPQLFYLPCSLTNICMVTKLTCFPVDM
jgi:hypothetical protein